MHNNHVVVVLGSKVSKAGREWDFRKLNQSETDELMRTTFNITTDSSYDQIRLVLENVALYMVNLLEGYPAKLDHNAFVMHPRDNPRVDGPFVYIDNDRTSWRGATTMVKWRISDNDPLCQSTRPHPSINDPHCCALLSLTHSLSLSLSLSHSLSSLPVPQEYR